MTVFLRGHLAHPSWLCLLVIEDDVRPPDLFRGDVDFFHPTIVLWIPFQVAIYPLLERETCH